MPWQGQSDNMIDRFDVRAHLDYLPEFKIVAPPTYVYYKYFYYGIIMITPKMIIVG